MRAASCAVIFNEILQTEAGLEEMCAESRDTVNEKYAIASPKLVRMWLERRRHRSAKSGHYSHQTAAPHHQASPSPEGPLLFISPRASKPNSLDDSWTFSLHHVGRPTRRKPALQRGSSRPLAHSFLLCLSTWSRVTSPHALSIYGK